MSNFLNKPADSARDYLTVSQLTAQIRQTLEMDFARVAVAGEISNWTLASSGHAYFSIKDEGALLTCVMWRSATGRLRFRPSEGVQVECRGRLSVFDKRGQYQLVVESMSEAGKGSLWQRFEALKEKLAAEGLFDANRKRPIPLFPRTIGVVTSPTGAAIRDILSVLQRRAPSVSVLIWPCKVQGDGAGAELAEGVRRLGRRGKVDALLVGRGGGSFEDLFEFNDEALARAIAASPVPVVSAVGHEIDFSISDFVADLRAPTPSAGAEILSAGYEDLRERLLDCMGRSQRAAQGRLRDLHQKLQGLLQNHAMRRPELELREMQQRADLAMRALPQLIARRVQTTRAQLQRLNGSLEGHNPELILKKGYAVIRRHRDGKVLMNVDQLKKNLPVRLQVRDGSRDAVITDDHGTDLFA